MLFSLDRFCIIIIINCSKSYVLHSDSEEGRNSSGAVYFNQCANVNMSRISLTVQSGTAGIILLKEPKHLFFKILQLQQIVSTLLPSSQMLIYYHDYYSKADTSSPLEIQLSNYKYKIIGVCKISVALNVATNQTTFVTQSDKTSLIAT